VTVYGLAAGHNKGKRCPAPDQPPCNKNTQECDSCQPCLLPNDWHDGRPTAAQIEAYLPWFLDAPPSARCAKGGLGVYSDYIALKAGSNEVKGLNEGLVTSAFRSLSAPLSVQADFTAALAASRSIVDTANKQFALLHKGLLCCLPFSSVYRSFAQY
jgi:hypothetical protein